MTDITNHAIAGTFFIICDMPELPEVESFRKFIADTSLQQKIRDIQLATRGMLLDTTDQQLADILPGNSFTDTFRHGKFLFVKLKSGESLMLHFGMTGDLFYYNPEVQPHMPFVLRVEFTNGNYLVFSDWRRFGRIALVNDVENFIKKRGYGKDALQITVKEFLSLADKRKTSIKAVLLNQKIQAGIGNELTDEILFQSCIHPASIVAKLREKQLRDVFFKMKIILKKAVQQNADREKLKQYFFLNNRKAGLRCPRCKTKTEFETVAGRSSYFCPACQKVYR